MEYVVVDDNRRSKERVQLAHESPETYDTAFYAELALRAGETVLAPLGWDRDRYRRHLAGGTTPSLEQFNT